MSIPILLSIQGRQNYFREEPEIIRLETEGMMDCRGDTWEITYEESELTGLAGVTTTFLVEPEKITLRRTGRLYSTMVFQVGVTNESLYRTEFGDLMIAVQAIRLSCNLTRDGGTIDLDYHIVIEDSEAGEIGYHLEVRRR